MCGIKLKFLFFFATRTILGLEEVVPVEGDVCMALVVDVDNDDIASPCIDGRPRELAVNRKDGLFMAEPRDVALIYLKKSSFLHH
jgi:hypothetical protein